MKGYGWKDCSKQAGKNKDDSIKQLDKCVLNINSTNRQINIENFIINHP